MDLPGPPWTYVHDTAIPASGTRPAVRPRLTLSAPLRAHIDEASRRGLTGPAKGRPFLHKRAMGGRASELGIGVQRGLGPHAVAGILWALLSGNITTHDRATGSATGTALVGVPVMTAEAWSAAAAWATFLVAVVAAIVGLKQYRATSRASADQSRLAQALAEEEARPYVVAYMESSAVDVGFIELVVRNYGKTAARDVRMTATPELRRSTPNGDETEPVEVFQVLGLLAPGQEWRCYWDRTWMREKVGLPDEYEVALSYSDSAGTPLRPETLPLSWEPFLANGPLEVYGVHHAAKALRELQKTVARFGDSGAGRGVRVYVYDGDARDRRRQDSLAEMRAARARQDEIDSN